MDRIGYREAFPFEFLVMDTTWEIHLGKFRAYPDRQMDENHITIRR
jgi:hypothetical protein